MVTEILVTTDLKSDIKLSVGRWFKRVGDSVDRDDRIVEIDTDNVTHKMRASSPAYCLTFWCAMAEPSITAPCSERSQRTEETRSRRARRLVIICKFFRQSANTRQCSHDQH